MRMKQALRVQPVEPKGRPFEEIGTSKDVSQNGVYFVTQREVYCEGMRVLVTLPYHAPYSFQNYEYAGQVARVEELANGQRGVAIRFLPSSYKKSPKP